jgi:hypothetical protein
MYELYPKEAQFWPFFGAHCGPDSSVLRAGPLLLALPQKICCEVDGLAAPCSVGRVGKGGVELVLGYIQDMDSGVEEQSIGRPRSGQRRDSEVIVRVNFIQWIFSFSHHTIEFLLVDDSIAIPISLVDHLLEFFVRQILSQFVGNTLEIAE